MPRIGDPTPAWLKPENASVLDSPMTKALRKLATLIGANDPQSQVLALMNPLVPEGQATLSAPLQAIAKKIRAWHGSPHDFPPVRLIEMPDGKRLYQNMRELAETPTGARVIKEYPLGRFDLSKIGTGEGAQAYGHGLYFADVPDVSRGYRDNPLSRSASNEGGAGAMMRVGRTPVEDLYRRIDVGAARLPVQRAQLEYDKLSALEALMQHGDVLGVREAAKAGQVTPEALAWFERDVAPKFTRQGRLYEVEINADPDTLLDWDAPITQQPEPVRRAVGVPERLLKASDALDAKAEELLMRQVEITQRPGALRANGTLQGAALDEYNRLGLAKDALNEKRRELSGWSSVTGRDAYSGLGTPDVAARKLRDAGIPGIKYLDGGSRGAGEGTRNYVIFDDSLVSILKKYGVALPMIEGLRRKAQANNGRLPASDVEGLIQQ